MLKPHIWLTTGEVAFEAEFFDVCWDETTEACTHAKHTGYQHVGTAGFGAEKL